MALKRKTPLQSKQGLRRTGITRSSSTSALKRTTTARKPSPPDPLTPAIRAAVAQRSGGACEVRATRLCNGHGEHVHHRKLRRHNDHRPVNLLHVCLFCHTAIHATVARSYERGWLVRAHEDPEDIPARTGYE